MGFWRVVSRRGAIVALFAVTAWVAPPFARAGGYRSSNAATSDGAGGVIIAWEDSRAGERNIYAQRIDAAGHRQWPDTGVVVCNATGDQIVPLCISDGIGGAIIAWLDGRTGTQVYAQRISHAGVVQWGSNGVAVGTSQDEFLPCMATDGSGGCILAWSAYLGAASDVDLYAERLNASGVPQWNPSGVPVCLANRGQFSPQIVADGAGGAVVTWSDLRSGTKNIYAQRIKAAGSPQWAVDGVPLSASVGLNDDNPMIVADGTGGGFVTWWGDYNYCCPDTIEVRAQHVDGAGTRHWGANGQAVSGTNSYQVYPVLVPDDAGGAIVLWRDEDRPQTRVFLEAQRIGATGLTLWNPDGVETIGQFAGNYPALRDGAGGAFTVAEANGSSGSDIVAQHIDQNGALPWGANGASVCTVSGAQRFPSVVPDDAGGLIAVWEDFRDVAAGGDSSLYAQRINGSGVTQWSPQGLRVYFFPGDVVGLPPASGPALESVHPNPAVGPLTISFSLASSRPATLELLDVRGRRVATRALSMATGPHTLRWEYGASIHAGIYLVRLIQDQQAITRKVCVLR